MFVHVSACYIIIISSRIVSECVCVCRLTSCVKSFGFWRRGIETLKVGVGGGVHRYCNNRIQSINLKTMPTMPEILVLYCFACVKSMFTVVGLL